MLVLGVCPTPTGLGPPDIHYWPGVGAGSSLQEPLSLPTWWPCTTDLLLTLDSVEGSSPDSAEQ